MIDYKEVVDKAAELARLGPFESGMKERLAGDFERILSLFQVFSELPSNSSPSEASAAIGSTRKDEAKPFVARERVIANFPEKEGGLLKVPKVLE